MADALDPVLSAVAEQVEHAGLSAHLLTPDWNVAWVSSEARRLLGEEDPERLGYGQHFLLVAQSETYQRVSTWRSTVRAAARFLPAAIEDTPGGAAAIVDMLRPTVGDVVVDAVATVPHTSPPVWATTVNVAQPGMTPVPMSMLGVRVRAGDGSVAGVMVIWGAPLPAHLWPVVARGNAEMLDRMARLAEPGFRQAAVLFADVTSSSLLSRRLSSAGYFDLIRRLMTDIDRAVVKHDGVLGAHAGDGVTAFFVPDDAAPPSAAAQGAIAAAIAVREVATQVGSLVEDSAEAVPGFVRIGVHWGDRLYMGQLVTDGRLEVTALGDAVNECARIEESARPGEILASKDLIEVLDARAADDLGIDVGSLAYRVIGELPTASEKAVRDAGHLSVASVAGVAGVAGSRTDQRP